MPPYHAAPSVIARALAATYEGNLSQRRTVSQVEAVEPLAPFAECFERLFVRRDSLPSMR